MTINLTSQIEVSDCLVVSSSGSNTNHLDTRTALDPSNYDGATYYFEVVAYNLNVTTDYTVELRNAANTVMASILVIKNTSYTRYRSSSFTPTTGNEIYHIFTPQTAGASQVGLNASRIIIIQSGATKTRLQIPLLNGQSGTDYAIPSTYIQGIEAKFNWAMRRDSDYTATSVSWSFEATHYRFVSGTSFTSLFIANGGSQIIASELSTTNDSSNPAVQNVALSDGDFPNGTTVEVFHKGSGGSYLTKSCLYVTITGATFVSAFNRISAQHNFSAATITPDETQRCLAGDSAGVSYLEATTDLNAGADSGSVSLADAGTAEDGTTATTGVTISPLSQTKTLQRSLSSFITGGNRFILQAIAGSGRSGVVNAAFMVNTFTGTSAPASTDPSSFGYEVTPTPTTTATAIDFKYIKVYDFKYVSIPLANPVTYFETAWSDDGSPNIFKRFRKIIMEVDNIGGGTITVIPDIDSVSQTSFNITASGRQEFVYSFPADTTGYLWRVRVSTTTTMRVYGVKTESINDPTHGKVYESAWSSEGTIARKRFRDLLLDIDTFGSDVTVYPWIDGVQLSGFTANTATRQALVLSLPVDTTGKLARVTTSGNNHHTIYATKFTYIEEPHFGTVRETPWSDEGYSYDKLWKHMTVDIDTGGNSDTISFWLDGSVVDTFSVTTSNRELRTISFGGDVIGKLGRITTSSSDTQLFNVKYIVDQEPPDLEFADSYEQTFGYDGWKVLKRMYAAIKADSPVTVKIYGDETLMDTVTITTTLSSSVGYNKIRVDFATAVKAKLFRFKFTSDSTFKLYWEKSQVEMKALNRDDGWALYKFNPPQTY